MDLEGLIDEAARGEGRANKSAEAWGKIRKVAVDLKHKMIAQEDAVRMLKIEREKMAALGFAGAQLVYSFGLHELGEE